MDINKKLLSEDKKYFQECHQRWAEKRNRDIDSPNYKDEWYEEQCFNCKYFIPVAGIFVDDYGACTNFKSPFDKQVMFEHDGCDYYVFDENY